MKVVESVAATRCAAGAQNERVLRPLPWVFREPTHATADAPAAPTDEMANAH